MVTIWDHIGLLLLLVSVFGSGVLFGVLIAGRPHARASRAYRFVVYSSGVVFIVGMFVGVRMVIA